MAGPTTIPAAQMEFIKLSSTATGTRSVTAQGDVSINDSQVVREPKEQAHTTRPLLMKRHKHGMVTMTLVYDQDMRWLDDFEDGQIIMREMNGRQHVLQGCSLAIGDGVDKNTTQGETAELTFVLTTYDIQGA